MKIYKSAEGKQGKWAKKFPVRKNTVNLDILQKHRENTGNFVCSSCEFSDSTDTGYIVIFATKFSNFSKLVLLIY